MVNARVSALLCTIVLVFSSCGGGNEGNRSPAAPVPPDEQPTDGNVGAGGTTDNWTALYEEFTGDMVAPTTCNFPWKFTVHNNGHFIAGPCTSGDDEVIGSVSQHELSELARRAEAVMDSDLVEPAQCESFSPIGSDAVDLTFASGETRRVFEYSPSAQSVCYRGSRDSTRALAAFMNELMTKYYPKRN